MSIPRRSESITMAVDRWDSLAEKVRESGATIGPNKRPSWRAYLRMVADGKKATVDGDQLAKIETMLRAACAATSLKIARRRAEIALAAFHEARITK